MRRVTCPNPAAEADGPPSSSQRLGIPSSQRIVDVLLGEFSFALTIFFIALCQKTLDPTGVLAAARGEALSLPDTRRQPFFSALRRGVTFGTDKEGAIEV